MPLTDPEILSRYIADEIRDIVPVDTGSLRASIEPSETGVLAVDYYPYVMSIPENAANEREAIDRGTQLYLLDLEQDIENLFE